MKKYLIRVTGESFFEVYEIKAENLFFAKMMARNKFLENYPCEKGKIGTKLERVNKKQVEEIMQILSKKEAV